MRGLGQGNKLQHQRQGWGHTFCGKCKRAARSESGRPCTAEIDKQMAFGMKQGTARDVVAAEAMTAG